MNVRAAFPYLSTQLLNLKEVLARLQQIIIEQKPRRGKFSVPAQLTAVVEGSRRLVDEALTATGEFQQAVIPPVDMDRARRSLTAIHEACNRLSRTFSAELMSYECMDQLKQLGRRRGPGWGEWTRSIQEELERCQSLINDVNDSLFACWHELASAAGTSVAVLPKPSVSQSSPSPDSPKIPEVGEGPKRTALRRPVDNSQGLVLVSRHELRQSARDKARRRKQRQEQAPQSVLSEDESREEAAWKHVQETGRAVYLDGRLLMPNGMNAWQALEYLPEEMRQQARENLDQTVVELMRISLQGARRQIREKAREEGKLESYDALPEIAKAALAEWAVRLHWGMPEAPLKEIIERLQSEGKSDKVRTKQQDAAKKRGPNGKKPPKKL